MVVVALISCSWGSSVHDDARVRWARFKSSSQITFGLGLIGAHPIVLQGKIKDISPLSVRGQ